MSYLSRIVTAPDGSTRYVSIDGDMIDAVANAFFGEHGRNTEAILELNPGLAAKGAILPAGTVIKLPDVTETSPTPEVVSLWE